ncbi:class I SAM-dependent methyltransferase, partial [Candidatus Gottesmanbacteria bacterium]|nr:class I SAM-dependent methyltransferase [Candidatus Gottesmanbacteria bacterium]
MSITKCVLCGGIKFRTLYKKFSYQVYICQFCDFIFIYPFPGKRQLEKYYKSFDYKTGFINENLIRKDSIRTLKNLEILGYSNKSLLDIGCGAGFFIDEARKRGWQVQGIDKSIITTKYARNKLKLKVINSDFIDYKFFNRKYKIITLLQVIEHLSNPRIMLEKIYNLLESSGILCIATPNIDSYLARALTSNFTYMIPPEHISFYSAVTLKRILESINFKIIKVDTWGYPSDLAAIIKSKIKKKISPRDNISRIPNGINFKSSTKRFKSILFDSIFCQI